jgi:hypothetical protein
MSEDYLSLTQSIADHERAIAALRKERSGIIGKLVAEAYVPDEHGTWPLLKIVANRLGRSVATVRQEIAKQTPAPGDDVLLEAILRARGEWIPYKQISRELQISPLRARDILARHWKQIDEERARNRPKVEPSRVSNLLTLDMITREAIRLYRNSNWFLRTTESGWGYDRHIRDWRLMQGFPDDNEDDNGGMTNNVGRLRIRLPNEYVAKEPRGA